MLWKQRLRQLAAFYNELPQIDFNDLQEHAEIDLIDESIPTGIREPTLEAESKSCASCNLNQESVECDWLDPVEELFFLHYLANTRINLNVRQVCWHEFLSFVYFSHTGDNEIL